MVASAGDWRDVRMEASIFIKPLVGRSDLLLLRVELSKVVVAVGD